MSLKLNEIFPKLIKNMRPIERKVIKAGWKQASKLMKEDIISSLERGTSPVEGEKRFQRYSKSYSEAIKKGRVPGKKLRPVNMKVSGALYESIKSKKVSAGFNIVFTLKVKSGELLAEIHSFMGAGKSRAIRMLLPDSDGDFKKSIKKRAHEHLKKTTEKVLTKMLRRF